MKYTKRPWKILIDSTTPSYTLDLEEMGLTTIQSDENTGNALLIKQAPLMLEYLVRTYLEMQIEAQKDSSFAVRSNKIRANLRNTISLVMDTNDINIQELVEELSFDVKNMHISFEEAVNKILNY